jgi:hypothetical protein
MIRELCYPSRLVDGNKGLRVSRFHHGKFHQHFYLCESIKIKNRVMEVTAVVIAREMMILQ